MSKEEKRVQCIALTKQKKRCKNSSVYGGYCQTHRHLLNETKHSGLTNAERDTRLVNTLVAGTSLILIIEKVQQYLPQIMSLLEMINLSGKCSICPPPPTTMMLKESSERGELWMINSYTHILHGQLSRYKEYLESGDENVLGILNGHPQVNLYKKIPPEACSSLITSCEEVLKEIQSYKIKVA